jgi:hypothetical protein
MPDLQKGFDIYCEFVMHVAKAWDVCSCKKDM